MTPQAPPISPEPTVARPDEHKTTPLEAPDIEPIEEQRVSRTHAILVRHGHHTRLLDNRSANGTFVNGRRIIATNITDGDLIRVGPVVMTYLQVA